MFKTSEALRLDRICRHFGNLRANDGISMTVNPGEVHALLGENGAGKSTLMRIVAGVISPDSGSIHVDSLKVDMRSPQDAARHGIQMVHQHFALIESLTVAENLHLAQATRLRERIDLSKTRRQLVQLSDEYGIHLPPDALVQELPLGSRQRLEIARALTMKARILILDEPTAVLAPSEVDDLFRLLRTLRLHGAATLFISHKFAEVLAVTDRITVLRHGRVVDSLATSSATMERLSIAVVGRALRTARPQNDQPAPAVGPPLLELRRVSTKAVRKGVPWRGIILRVCSAEIVGIAGVDGNGQSELTDLIAGIVKPDTGEVRVAKDAQFSQDSGSTLAHIPDDRSRKGLVLTMTCQENLLLRHRFNPLFFRFGMVRQRSARKLTAGMLNEFMVRAAALDEPAGKLSGGNQQRLLLARELFGTPKIIVVAQPTRGVDVAGAAFVHQTLRHYRSRGAGILVVSAELDELIALADRIIVMFRGEFMGEVSGRDADRLRLGLMMGGEHCAPPAALMAAAQ